MPRDEWFEVRPSVRRKEVLPVHGMFLSPDRSQTPDVYIHPQVWSKLSSLIEDEEALAWLRDATAPVARLP